ncbi:MAG: DUF4143 domain-containing protein [Planctomycetes bacterium]|nr:DUF4143 domain-containing protein [Planctomycetota bacterium]
MLGIERAEQLRQHPLRGSVFENRVGSEIYTSRRRRGLEPELFFYRDQSGREADLVADDPLDPTLIEIKLTRTVLAEPLRPLDEVARVLAGAEIPPRSVRRVLDRTVEESSAPAEPNACPGGRCAGSSFDLARAAARAGRAGRERRTQPLAQPPGATSRRGSSRTRSSGPASECYSADHGVPPGRLPLWSQA